MSLPVYATREQVKDALDLKDTARANRRIDDAIAAGSRDVDRLCHRIFWPQTGSRTFDWPHPTQATPWLIWLSEGVGDPPMPDLATLTGLVSGGAAIPTTAALLRPDEGPPYTRLEIDTSTAYALGSGPTWQRAITATGVWAYSLDTAAAGQLAEDLDAAETAVDVTDSGSIGVGDLVLAGTERMHVTGKTMADTTRTVAGAGLAASTAGQALTVSAGTWFVGETLLIDSERLYVDDVAATTLVVRRGWDGTTVAAHAAATPIWAPRTLTVERAAAGTTAATHTSGAALTRHLPPGLVNQYVIAHALDALEQQASGYARTVGSGDNTRPAPGRALSDLRDRVYAAHGRKARVRSI
jgi:hypothetical protein